jgi:hypothetical protein
MASRRRKSLLQLSPERRAIGTGSRRSSVIVNRWKSTFAKAALVSRM